MHVDTNSWQTLWLNVHLATMSESISDSDNEYGVINHAALAISNGKIVWFGPMDDLPIYDKNSINCIDGKGQWLTPGLIDCHTHIVYGGNRANEFEMRLQGKTYEEIAKAGGGIVSTVSATRQATEEQLLNSAKPRLEALHREGVTTLEIKSGYGLDTETEIKMLKVAKALEQQFPVTIKKTFLGAHAIPTEFTGNSQGYIDEVCNNMLPAVAKHNLADAVDVFCENIGFTLPETKQVFDAAKNHNLPIKIHAEQLSNMKGTELASEYDALSADHLEYLDESGVIKMKNADMTAVLLPGAYYFLRETQLPPIELLRQHQVPIAIATDANPGSSPLHSIQLMINMACTLFKMTPFEALAGVTVNAAKALGIDDQKGKIEIGYDADLACWNIEQPAQLAYQFGVNPLTKLMKNGKQVL
jgi:imidazolonepropionase